MKRKRKKPRNNADKAKGQDSLNSQSGAPAPDTEPRPGLDFGGMDMSNFKKNLGCG